MSLLRVQGLSRSFGGLKAVDDVSFDLEAGQLLALLGPNGAGKSTCFNMVNGQLRPSSGSIRLDGRELVGLRPRDIWRLGVGRTFQIAATFNSMTVLENVQMALVSRERKLFGLWKPAASWYADEAMSLLGQVGMADAAQRACGVLAYGDVKRVELAIALANRPKLLLMDEPTAGMAPQERNALMGLTRRLVNAHGIGVLFTEHSMDVVFNYADRMIVLARGKLIAEGDAATIRNDARVQAVYFGTGKTFEAHAAFARDDRGRHCDSDGSDAQETLQ
jgi:branched-chain amino acid transport system ATP-binding protein